MQLRPIIAAALQTLWTIGDYVTAIRYVRPVGHNPSTGQTTSVETTLALQVLRADFRGPEILLSSLNEDDTKFVARAADMASLGEPWPGDYVIEDATGTRRDIIAVRLDGYRLMWTLTVRRNPNEDYGPLDAATAFEDYGDLSVATAFIDYGPLA